MPLANVSLTEPLLWSRVDDGAKEKNKRKKGRKKEEEEGEERGEGSFSLTVKE